MKDAIAHERMRFGSMTPAQLFTRLGKITKPDKLQNFIWVAREMGLDSLALQAQRKRNDIVSGSKVIRPEVKTPQIAPERAKSSLPVKRTETIKQTKKYRRAIEF